MDPKTVVSQLPRTAKALAIPSIVKGGATGTPVVSNMFVTSVQGHTQVVTAPNSQGNHGSLGILIKTVQGNPLTQPFPEKVRHSLGLYPLLLMLIA